MKHASSWRLARYVSVPMLQLIASDDFLCANAFRSKFDFMVTNPYVMVVQSRCGGHLGWQESNPEGQMCSWSDVAVTEFIHAVFATHHLRKGERLDVDPILGREVLQGNPRCKL